MPKRTYQPSKIKRRKVGFLKRNNSSSGKKIIKRRRQKGRQKLAH